MAQSVSARYLTATTLGLLADQMYFVAIGWAAAQTHGGRGAALVLSTGTLARVGGLLLGGVLADRIGPARLAAWTDVARGVLMLCGTTTALVENVSLPAFVVMSLAFGAVDALFLPAVGSLPAQLTNKDRVPRLHAARQATQRASLIVGAPVAGMIFGLNGFAGVLGVNAALFFLSAALFAGLRTYPTDTNRAAGVFSEAIAELVYVWREPVLRSAVLLIAFTELCLSGVFNIGLPLIAVERNWGASGFGILVGAFGIGAATASAAIAIRPVTAAGLISAISIAAIGPGLLLTAISSKLVLAGTALVFVGVAAGLCSPLLIALVTARTDPTMQGRVMAVLAIAGYCGVPISYFTVGVAVDLVGTTIPFVVSGGLAVGVGVVAAINPTIRRARL